MKYLALLKGIALTVMAIVPVATGLASAAAAEPLYVSPMPNNLNVRFLENHIIIDRPAAQVFDYITTPAKTARYFSQEENGVRIGMRSFTVVKGGPADKPQQLGTTALEVIEPPKPGAPPFSALYTVISLTPGHQIVSAGQFYRPDGTLSPDINMVADWSVRALPGGRSEFVRVWMVFQDPKHPIPENPSMDVRWSQGVLEKLKRMVEADIPK